MKLSPMINLRKEIEIGGYVWRAYLRGTNNRVCRSNGDKVPAYTKQSDLKFDLLNNPMERGVLAYESIA